MIKLQELNYEFTETWITYIPIQKNLNSKLSNDKYFFQENFALLACVVHTTKLCLLLVIF